MSGWQILVLVIIIIVALILLAGLFNMMRGGSPNLSQKLMRARVLVQLIAVIVMMTVLYFMQRGDT